MGVTYLNYPAGLFRPWDGTALAVAIVVAPILAIAGWWVTAYFTSPLRQYPGPGLAAWTNLWRLSVVRTGSYHVKIKELHDKYGAVVRIGPNTLDLDFPELIKTLYGTDGKWKKVRVVPLPLPANILAHTMSKTEFYHNNSAIIDGRVTYHLFSTTDQAEHARMKRPIVKYYSQSSVMGIEPLFDTLIGDFCHHLEKRFMTTSKPTACDLGEWIGFYSWDANGAASFSQRFGYMDEGCDYDGTISIADKALDYFAAVGQMPFLDFLLDKNPVMRIGPPNLANITRISLEHLVSRLQGKDPNYDPNVPDFLQHFIESKQAHPELVNDGIIMGYLLVNLLAGADTTAITIRAIFWHALHQPLVYRRLEQEILSGELSDVASYSSARALPYLEAVIHEAMRMHPGVCMLLERYVPDGGLDLPDGTHVPANVAVGINPYVIGRNKSIWGDDANTYRPERWLQNEDESDAAYKTRLRLYNASDLTFGGGSRVCIGRNLAHLEVYKIVATLIRRYEISLVDLNRPWKVTGSWFPRQRGLICHLKKRNQGSC
ncbi:benzoate 4-monooxygenase cytochrome p450 [Colletotrichum chrysophilum]|uniref:Benzoate 4-monooxygenase cytochrome p450 n=2 Tax=Colletotrichum chrysophilum TaxID=1836956 RepID=A0AAD9ANB9_9PEZI|nr:benzoate 4-monooxygenase cytochrome p450 [Colletotrichum chrysophilum]